MPFAWAAAIQNSGVLVAYRAFTAAFWLAVNCGATASYKIDVLRGTKSASVHFADAKHMPVYQLYCAFAGFILPSSVRSKNDTSTTGAFGISGRRLKSPFASFKRSVRLTMLQEAAMYADWNTSLFSASQLSPKGSISLRPLLSRGHPHTSFSVLSPFMPSFATVG